MVSRVPRVFSVAGGLLLLFVAGSACVPTTPGSPPPATSSQPQIVGSASVGAVLSATTGTWTGSPTSYVYRWESCLRPSDTGTCELRADSLSNAYTVIAADQGRHIALRVTARNAAGSGDSARAVVGPVDAVPTPVQRHCGTVTGEEVWGAGTVHLFDCPVQVEGTVRVAPGAVLKLTGFNGFSVKTGGLVDFDGTAEEPVVVTVAKDDSVGGDSNGDGPLIGPPPNDGGEVLVYFPGFSSGRARIDHTEVRWASIPIQGGVAAEEVTITNSSFDYPETRPGGAGGWWDLERGYISIRECGDGAATNNRFNGYSIDFSGCSIPIQNNSFNRSRVSISGHDDLAAVDLDGPGRNTFSDPNQPVTVTLSGSIQDGDSFAIDGPGTGADAFAIYGIAASRSLTASGVDVAIRSGTVLKGRYTLFDLGPNSTFTALGTLSEPVVFTSVDDDSVGGDSELNGPSLTPTRLGQIFEASQGGGWTFLGALLGFDFSRVGPGIVDVDNAVVRHTDTAFAGCVACDTTVTNTDFINVGMGVTQSYYFVPLAPCATIMGRELLDGGNPVWNPAVATSNYWGGPGPSIDVNLFDIALAFAAADEQYRLVADGLPLEDLNVVTEARNGLIRQYGADAGTIQFGENAGVNVGVETCTIPVINVSFPVVIVPVDFAGAKSAPIHIAAGNGSW
jgi:hypothetical protein